MKVKCLVSFSDSVHGTRSAGDEFELPEGADWLRAGLVEAVGGAEGGAVPKDMAPFLVGDGTFFKVEPAPEPEAPKPARKKAKG